MTAPVSGVTSPSFLSLVSVWLLRVQDPESSIGGGLRGGAGIVENHHVVDVGLLIHRTGQDGAAR